MKYLDPRPLFVAILAVTVLALSFGPAAAQVADSRSGEVGPEDISPEMRSRWDFRVNPALSASRPEKETTQKLVRIIYLVPSDKVMRPDYRTAITESTLHIQNFYSNELGNGLRFTLHSPVVEVYTLSHAASYYGATPSRVGAPQYIWFWENALNEGLALVGGGMNDPNNRWIFHIDADTACGQIIGGNGGVVVMAANDFRGLVGEQNVPACVGESPDNGGHFRWVGGGAHEIAHSFNVPHPPGCGGPTGCTGGSTAANSLMWLGYASYPSTYFLPADKMTLLNSGFFTNNSFVSVSGRVMRSDGRGIAGARILITNATENRYAVTNPFGYYRFADIPGGATYFMLANHKSHIFNVHEITANGDLTAIDFQAQ